MRLFNLDISRRGILWAPPIQRSEGRRSIGRNSWQSPYLSAIRNQVPLAADLALYKVLREAIPCLDSAVNWLTLLVGRPEIIADEPLKTEIDEWLRSVQVNHLQQGFGSWVANHVDSMLWSGKAVGEIVPNNAGKDIYALTNLESDSIVYRQAVGSPLELIVCQQQTGAIEPVPLDPNWIIVNLHNPGTSPHGVSLFRSLPFVSEILATIENALQQTWQRFGCPTYRVNWQPPEEYSDPTGVKTAAVMKDIEDNFVTAMEARKEGQIRDFFSSNVEVGVIGADGQTLDFQAPHRAIMEQIVGRTGLPAWMLGFHWSTTERMSSVQADMLASLLNGIREELYPDLFHTLELRQQLAGRPVEFELIWNAVSLEDAVEAAKAQQMEAQAEATRTKTAQEWWRLGYVTQEQAAEHAIGEEWDGEIARSMEEPPAAVSPFSMDDGSSGGRGDRDEDGEQGNREDITLSACDCGHIHKSDDAGVSYGTGGRPRDDRIRDAINGFYRDARTAIRRLRRSTWRIFNLPAIEGAARRAAKAADDPFIYTPAQMRAFNRAVDLFLETMAGADRTKGGFVSFDTNDGLMQQWDRFAHGLGVRRAVELTDAQAASILPGRNSEAIQRLLENAFDRLSENGQLRLEGQLDDLRTIIKEGLDLGANPLEVAEAMADRFDSYEGWEFQRLARTEMSFSQNAGMADEFRAEGVDMSRVEADPPPFHPNCLCTISIEETETGGWVAVYDIALQACDLCQAYRSD